MSTDKKRAALLARALDGARDIAKLAAESHAADAQGRFTKLAHTCAALNIPASEVLMQAWFAYMTVIMATASVTIGKDATAVLFLRLLEALDKGELNPGEGTPREH